MKYLVIVSVPIANFLFRINLGKITIIECFAAKFSLPHDTLISNHFLWASLVTLSVRPEQLVVRFHIYSYMAAGCQQITGLSCDCARGGWDFVANYPDNTWTAGIQPNHDMSSSHVYES